MELSDVSVVVIGRNEGRRLERCLRSISPDVRLLVYVDSGSTDQSISIAESSGARVVELDMSTPFSAARARNAGASLVRQAAPQTKVIFFVDGDCEVDTNWIEQGLLPFSSPNIAAVCGIRRERHPDNSVFNMLCDVEWRQAPIGEAKSFGGDVLIRFEDFISVGGYDAGVIAAEDDELSIRLRMAGGRIVRLPNTSTLHDAAMFRWSQWFSRSVRCGHAYANVFDLHGAEGRKHFGRQLRSAVVWGGGVPLLGLFVLALWPIGLLGIIALYSLQVVRTTWGALKSDYSLKEALAWGPFCMMAKFPECLGASRYLLRKMLSHEFNIIEYK